MALILKRASASRTSGELYDARGNSVGTAAPQGEGSTRYYDAHNRTCPRAPPDVAQGVPRGHPLERRRARDADRALGLP
jgi:hypothetical protein